MSQKLKIVLMLASVRDGRLGARVGKYVKKVAEAKGFEVHLLDPLEHEKDMPLIHQPKHFIEMFGGGPDKVPQALKDVNSLLESADGYLFVTCEYNRMPGPALLNMLDYFPGKTYGWKPAAMVTYSMGMGGGSNAATVLPITLRELGMLCTPAVVSIPQAHINLSEAGELADSAKFVTKGMDLLLEQLLFTAEAMHAARHKQNVPPVSAY